MMNETKLPTTTDLVSLDSSEAWEGPQTVFVHLCSGKVKEVEGVTEVEVTQAQVILRRGDEQPATFLRQDVYFACCEEGEQPSF
jgi:hypothetical protein